MIYTLNRKGYVCFDSSCVEVELAMTHEERRVGLMSRTNIPENMGMLFIFEKEGIRKFWMKDTLIPLDIIWLDEMERIIHIEKNVMPCNIYCQSFGPELPTKFVLELNGGYTDRYDINVGDNVRMVF